MKMSIDLNADLGEGTGHDSELLKLVTSASIACGFHAGDPLTILKTLSAAKTAGVSVGAHPSLADREGFGRRELPITAEQAFALLTFQLGAFAAFAAEVGIRPRHVKPHGALYNMAARDPILAEAVVQAVACTDDALIVFAPPDSALARAAQARGLRVTREFFADRAYLPDRSLAPRSRPDALIHDPDEAAGRVMRMLSEGVVRAVDGSDVSLRCETICLHGDHPEAIEFARHLRATLEAAGVVVEAVR